MERIKEDSEVAGRYEEALEKARKFFESNASPEQKSCLQNIFPELAESEDERIRKAIIKHFKVGTEYVSFSGFSKSEVINWLEKQGEQKPSDEVEPIEWSGKINSRNVKGVLKEMLDKKLKSADKVGPKFKVGDFIVNYYCRGRVVELTEDAYLLDTEQGIPFSCEHNVHLWTIQDAKDGDVLIDKSSDKECPFIFKETKPSNIKTECLNPLTVLGYCGIGGAGFTKGSGWGDTANCIYYPATKEQRNTLMKAMADAGYTFDFEKKELKKIDWNPQPGDVFRKKGTISPKYHLCAKREDGITFGFVENSEVCISGGEITIFALRNDYELVEKLKPMENIIKEEFNKVVCPNDAWSEEDEKIYTSILNDLRQNVIPDKEDIDWLKSLKDKIQPQPKQEWSEEDYNEIETIACHLDNTDNEGMAEVLRSIRDKYYHIIPQNT